MIITVKNLQQQTFTIEFEPEKTVLELKEQIFKERGAEYVVAKQKLIYAGVILDDERSIASYNVTEKKFLVVMLKRDLKGGSPQEPGDAGATASQSEGSATPACISSALDTPSQPKSTDTVSAGKSSEEGKTGSGSDEDTKSIGSDNSGGVPALGPVGSNTSILSGASGSSMQIGSAGSGSSGGSETSRSTYSSGDLAGVFSSTSLQSRAESNLLMGEEYNRTVESMIEMGYCREMVERAMAASYNNPERAVEYLISGIPETDDGFNTAAAAAAEEDSLISQSRTGESPRVGANRSGDGAGGDGMPGGDGVVSGAPSAEVTASRIAAAVGAGVRPTNTDGSTGSAADGREDPFEFLRNQPQFLQMRSLVYTNPDLLHAVLQQIGQTNPALLQLISENQDAFLSMLNQPMEGQGNPQYPRRMTLGRRAQLAAAARDAASGDGFHVRPLDTAAGAGGDDPQQQRRPGEAGDAGGDDEWRRAAVADVLRERDAARTALAALTAAATAAERNAGGDEGGGGGVAAQPRADDVPTTESVPGAEEAGNEGILRLTPQDRDSIERLKALGFPEALVLQAYFVCDKDEQLAANFLISSAFDD